MNGCFSLCFTMITVLQLCEHFGGREASLHGVARAFQWWLPNFDKNYFRVLLCSRKGPDKASEQMRDAGLNPLFLGYNKIDPRNLTALLRLMRQESVDIIHAHGYGASTWGRIAGRLLRKPVIIHERCNYGTVPLYQRPIERLLGPGTRYALAVSKSSKQFCVDKRYIPAEAIQVLYHGILPEDVKPADPAWIEALRAQNSAPDSVIIGIVGRLEPHKGHLDALNALSKLQQTNWQLWIIGDGSYGEILRQHAQKLNLTKRVVFMGFRPDARQAIQALDLQLFPSHMEGTPNTLYEALMAGNPIVASTADGQGEILHDGIDSLLFSPGDIDTLGTQLERAIKDSELRSALRTQSRRLAADFDGRKAIQKMQQLYRQIMRETSSQSSA